MFPLVNSAAVAAIVVFSTFPQTGIADSGSGAYLAGRQAAYRSDFETAARYYTRALALDSSNPTLMENAVLSNLALGQVDRALPIAQMMESRELRSQIAHMVIVASLIADEDYDGLLARDIEDQGIGPLVDGLLRGWALL
ncbi:MAG: hypothetical protein AAF408_16675, partial [Pseudomonadota bacterium]